MPWALLTEQRVTRLESELKAMELRLAKLDYGLNHHKHEKVTDSPLFDCI